MPKLKKNVNARTGKPLSKYKLLAGGHEQADPRWEPSEEEIESAKLRGTTPRAPTKKYSAGDTVESDKDLINLFGANKFQLLGEPRRSGNLGEDVEGDPTPQNMEEGYSHPGGQVNTGFQSTGGLDESELRDRGLIPDAPDYSKVDKKRIEAQEKYKAKVDQAEAPEDEEAEEAPKPKAAKEATSTVGTSHKAHHKESAVDKSKKSDK